MGMWFEFPPTEKFDGEAVWDFTLNCLKAALPKFMRKGGLQQGEKERHITSYLDALRGFAACVVVNHHVSVYKNVWFFKLPFAALLASGDAAVQIFFVISGYVLSYQLLKLMRARDGSKLFDKTTSALFRRYIRLYGSSVVAAFISFLLFRLDLIPGGPHFDTFFEHFADWLRETIAFGSPFGETKSNFRLPGPGILNHRYLITIWTIPLEFRGSLLIYFFCIATARLSYRNRAFLGWFIAAAAYWWCEFYAVMFLCGLLIADSSIARGPKLALPPADLLTGTETVAKGRSRLECSCIAAVFVFALFVLGYEYGADSTGPWPWNYLYSLIPSHVLDTKLESQFWACVGAVLLVWSLDSFPALQAPLKWDVSQYLGEISFGIYVMHILVAYSFRDKVLTPLRVAYLGESLWAFIPVDIVNWIAVLCTADWFSRIDKQVVYFAKWLESKVFTVQFRDPGLQESI